MVKSLQHIFRAYDIRGTVGKDITDAFAFILGQAIGTKASALNERCIAVGYDGRLSSPALAEQLINGLLSCGLEVLSLGEVTTPVLYYAASTRCSSGVMVTASHNPAPDNGFKVMLAGNTLAKEQIRELYDIACEGVFSLSDDGTCQTVDLREAYFERIVQEIHLVRPLKVVVDCGNGVPGAWVPALLERLGCEVIPLYCDVDGTFPNHHPDPTRPENIKELIATVLREKADLGLGLDGDGDRLGVITPQGEVIWPDRQMMLFAKDVLSHHPGATILYDVKSTRQLGRCIEQHGGKAVMCQTGHSLVKRQLKEMNAALAGEMSGHIFFNDVWYGFDDGAYTAARLLAILSQHENIQAVFDALPDSVNTPEIHQPIADEKKFSAMKLLQEEAVFPGAEDIIRIDGLRVEFEKGWGLVRASNTTPCLVLRFEADTQEDLVHIQSLFCQVFQTVLPELSIAWAPTC